MEGGLASALLPMNESLEKTGDFTKLPRIPAPWQLKGEGIIMVYKFSKDWAEKSGHLPDHLKGKFAGGLGYLMLVNYEDSPVGPYHELLLIPGKFSPNKKQSITKIYVDSEHSTQNGRANWGIPKDTLPFSWKEDHGNTTIQIKANGKSIFDCSIKSFGIPFPASTHLLPIDLHQLWEGKDFFTKPSGKGWGKLAKVKFKHIDTNFFPDVRDQKLLLAVKINPFQIKFPSPKDAI